MPQQLEKFQSLLLSFNVVSSSVSTKSVLHCPEQIQEEISPHTSGKTKKHQKAPATFLACLAKQRFLKNDLLSLAFCIFS